MKQLRQLAARLPGAGALHRAAQTAATNAEQVTSRIRAGLARFFFNVVWEARIRHLSKRPRGTPRTKPVIHLYAICWNEEAILPYFMDHYSGFVDEFFIYDNMSTDGTLALLARYKNTTVIPYDTGNTYSDAAFLDIKNHAWKRSRGIADFVIVCDMDEFLYHPEMPILLDLLHTHHYTVAKPHGYNMTSTSLPPFDGTQQITSLIRSGVDARKNYSKNILFSPTLDEINFSTGCHKSFPQGRVKTYQSDHLKLLHYKFVDRDQVLAKTRVYGARMSDLNKKHGWSRHYIKTDEKTLADFDRIVSRGKDII